MLLLSLVLLDEAKYEVLEEFLSRPLPKCLGPSMPGLFKALPDLLINGRLLVGTKKLMLECVQILQKVFIPRALIS